MAKQTPLQIVKEKHGSKEKLVEAVAAVVEPMDDDEDADELKERLSLVSNAKLLHLLEVGTRVKDLGGRDTLVEQIASARGQSKDKDFVAQLGKVSLGQLLDMKSSVDKKTKKAAAKKA